MESTFPLLFRVAMDLDLALAAQTCAVPCERVFRRANRPFGSHYGTRQGLEDNATEEHELFNARGIALNLQVETNLVLRSDSTRRAFLTRINFALTAAAMHEEAGASKKSKLEGVDRLRRVRDNRALYGIWTTHQTNLLSFFCPLGDGSKTAWTSTSDPVVPSCPICDAGAINARGLVQDTCRWRLIARVTLVKSNKRQSSVLECPVDRRWSHEHASGSKLAADSMQ